MNKGRPREEHPVQGHPVEPGPEHILESGREPSNGLFLPWERIFPELCFLHPELGVRCSQQQLSEILLCRWIRMLS